MLYSRSADNSGQPETAPPRGWPDVRRHVRRGRPCRVGRATRIGTSIHRPWRRRKSRRSNDSTGARRPPHREKKPL